MDIALMNVRITIQKAAVASDDIGNRKNTWEDYYYCAATVGDEYGMEKEEAAQTVDHSDITFTVRSCSLADAVTSDGFRILFNGVVYDIFSIDHMNYKHKCVKYRCRKAGRWT